MEREGELEEKDEREGKRKERVERGNGGREGWREKCGKGRGHFIVVDRSGLKVQKGRGLGKGFGRY